MENVSKKNIVVFLVDTMRASALAEPGLANMNRIARKGITYTNAVSPGTWTAPSHASLFTDIPVSKIPEVSKDFLEGGTKSIDPWMVKTNFLGKGQVTLAEQMEAMGYQTSLFSNNPFLTSFTGLGRGFGNIEDLWLNSNLKYNRGLVERLSAIINGGASVREKMFKVSYYMTRMLPASMLDKMYINLRQRLNDGIAKADGTHRLDRGASDTQRAISKFMDYKYNFGPQFMFINYIEAHENYPVSKGKDIVQDKWMYLSGIRELDKSVTDEFYGAYTRRLRYLDKKIGSTLGMMKQKGLLDNATVVLTADHGQFFGEHGLLYHSLRPYEGVSKVPLISVNYENGKMVGNGERVDEVVSLRALNGALLGIASQRDDHLNGNVKRSKFVISEHSGISEGWDADFLKMLKSRSKSARMIYDAKTRCNRKATAIYSKDLKLIHNFRSGRDELYDISSDPQEQFNIIDGNRARALELARAI